MIANLPSTPSRPISISEWDQVHTFTQSYEEIGLTVLGVGLGVHGTPPNRQAVLETCRLGTGYDANSYITGEKYVYGPGEAIVLGGEYTNVTSGRWCGDRWLRPDGSTYSESVNHQLIPDPQDYGYEYWSWYNVVFFYDPMPVSMQTTEGSWGVEWIDEGSAVCNRSFTSMYVLAGHVMCTDVQPDYPWDPIDIRSSFSADDAQCVSWVRLDDFALNNTDDITWRWYGPEGFYLEHSEDLDNPGSGSWFDWHKAYCWIDIAGHYPSQNTGSWHVDVYIKDYSGTEEYVYAVYFTIDGAPGPDISISPTSLTFDYSTRKRADTPVPPIGMPADAHDRSSPHPPLDMHWGISTGEKINGVLIDDAPAYNWYRGCSPTALGMIIGYWDMRGFGSLVPGDASSQTAAVDAMISSTGNWDDYCLPLDSEDNILPDLSELPLGDEHPNDCVADFMNTSQSYHSLPYGWSWFSDIGPAWIGYIEGVDAVLLPSYANRYWGSFSWSEFTTELDEGRPMVFLVDSDADGDTDHMVTVIGYNSDNQTYACLNTWDDAVHWYDFAGMSPGQPFGIYGAVLVRLDCVGSFIVRNDGIGALDISSVVAEGSSNWIESVLPSAPISIASGETRAFAVKVNPSLAPDGTNNDRILVYSNDPDENPYPGAVYLTLLTENVYCGPVWHVSTTGSDLTGNGSAGNPFATIQRGLNGAAPGDTVLIADGIYTGPGNRNLNPAGMELVIRSAAGAGMTIVDCGGADRFISYSNGESNSSVLDGITIRNGNMSNTGGGAIYCDNASPIVRNCEFLDNAAPRGGAIFCENSAIVLDQCMYTSNHAEGDGQGLGGAIYSRDSTPTITSCTFENNSVGAYYYYGAAIYGLDSDMLITGCNFANNSGARYGGAVSLVCTTGQEANASIIDGCLFHGHAVDYNGDVISALRVDLTLVNCTLGNNGGTGVHGVLYVDESSLSLNNSMIVDNTISTAVACGTGVVLDVACSNVHNNGGDYTGCLASFATINDNMSVDPQFCGTDNPSDPYSLNECSPCSPGNTHCGIVGSQQVGCVATQAVIVDVEPDSLAAPWELTPPSGGSLFGQGDSCLSGAETGFYMITWLPVTGWIEPEPEFLFLEIDMSIVFQGSYVQYGIVSVDVDPDDVEAAWFLDGPDDQVYQVSGDTILTDMVPGEYTITWGDEPEWSEPQPNPVVQQLPPGGEASFLGVYAPEGSVIITPEGDGNYPTIQAAIDAVASPAEIVLTDGIFTGDGNRDIDYSGKAITIRSENGDPSLCIIDCQGSVSDPHRGFYFQSSEESTSVLMGVGIRNGYSADYGGGIRCQDYSSPHIENCIVSNCTAAIDGGGLYCHNYAFPTVQGCTFSGNTAEANGGGIHFSIYAGGTVLYCTIVGNTATDQGGGMWCRNVPANLDNCTFYGNSAPEGGGIYLFESAPNFDNTIIAFSLAGGAIDCGAYTGSNPVLSCCDIYGNVGGDWADCIADQDGINGNISEDPVFCDSGSGDYRLAPSSPCSGGNNPSCGLIGSLAADCAITGITDGSVALVFTKLYQSSPNPFNPTTTIKYELPTQAHVRMRIFDLSGRLVRVLVSGDSVEAGSYETVWNGKDDAGRPVPSGTYFYRLTAGPYSATRRMVLVK